MVTTTVEVLYAKLTIHVTDLQIGPIPERYVSKMEESTTVLQRNLAEYEFKKQMLLKDHILLKALRENLQFEIVKKTIEKELTENRKGKRRSRWEIEAFEENEVSPQDRKKKKIQHVEPDSDTESEYEQDDENDEESEKNAEDDATTSSECEDNNEEYFESDDNVKNITLHESDASISSNGKRNDKEQGTIEKETTNDDSLISKKESVLLPENESRLATENQQSNEEHFREESNGENEENTEAEDNTDVKTAIEDKAIEEFIEKQEEKRRESMSNNESGKARSSDKKKEVPECWLKRYQELLEFKEKFGHCDVPKGRPPTTLGNWVYHQRQYGNKFREGQYARGMNQKRYELLDKIGFRWSALKTFKRQKRNEEPWVKQYMDLVQYKEKFGNCDVPKGYPLKSLVNWVLAQRQCGKKFREGRGGRGMTKERYEMLDKLGFNWCMLPPWEDFYDKLKQYKAKYGNCHVPRQWEKDKKLSAWAVQMRHHGRLFREGKETYAMTPERYALLDDIGFCWDRYEEVFMKNFEELKRYKEKYGDCRVKRRHDSKLDDFVQRLRKQYQSYKAGKRVDSMTPERIEMLENIGFVWKAGKSRNKKHKEESGP